MKYISITLCTFLLTIDITAQIKVQDLITLSKNYYTSLEKFSIIVDTKFKNAITIDTSHRLEASYIDKSQQVKFFKRPENILLRMNSDEYMISNNNSFQKLETRKSTYGQTYIYYPFVEPKLFFGDIEHSISDGSKRTETDSTYLVSYKTSGIKIIEFRKNDYSIRSVTEIVYDRLNKGFQFKRIVFGPAHLLSKSDQEEIKGAITIVMDPSKKALFIKEEQPIFIDRSLIEQSLKKLKNSNVETITNKVVCLDFFYQSCYPCVKSYPFVNELYENKDLGVILIGVDVVLQDSLTIEKYIEKYKLRYPILVGETAVSLQQYFKLTDAPVFIIITPDGKLNYHVGFTKSSFKRFTIHLTKQ